MPYWENRPASASNIRLYVPGSSWRKATDEPPVVDGEQPKSGAAAGISSVLLNVLNATHVVVLTGTGSSFAAVNPPEGLSPAGMWEVWEAVRAATGDEAFNAVVATFGEARIGQNIERLLSMCRLYLELKEAAPQGQQNEERQRIAAFAVAAETAILSRVDFVNSATNLDAHAALMQKIGRRGARKPRAKLFTTNYDLCFEEVARRSRFMLIDGFSHTLQQTYDRLNFGLDVVRRDGGRDSPDYVQNALQFYKLHGSIDWRRDGGEILRTRKQVGSPVLIYPRSSKYQESFDAPYLDMLSSFQSALREPDTALLVSGFGFNDDHISSPIMSAVESNMSLRLVICDPAFLGDETLEADGHDIPAGAPPEHRFIAFFRALADAGDARIHLMNGRFEDLTSALPDLIGEDDRERHVQRMRSFRDAAGGNL
ncbi:SIR2-like domain-containing protein [Sphingomonas guangdongensis]|uniref:SIR2-like domain-containing protein n=1 Tax=Sphingomonas guangdongensis TaxID=1141890 RepID=A0A285QCA2_9SPHN|nr:SIR2 family protein [Sphingomonas guangdongensis]SOB79124.1 SIR2-like domain-containing protein [Sphingomonas guangdongensis]